MKDSLCKKINLLVLVMCLCLPALSQNGNPLQFLRGVSQSSFVNPAFQNKTEKLVVGIPLISGASLNWNANFSFEYFTSERFTFDYQKFYKSLNEPGDAFSTAQAPIIYLSIRKGKKEYSFSMNEKVIGTTYFDNEFLNFAAQGLLPYYNNDDQFSPLSFEGQYYREIALGFSNEIKKGFTIGIRPKILFGKFYYESDNVSLNVNTNNETEQLLISPIGNYTISGPVKVVTDEEKGSISVEPNIKSNDYFFSFKNMGASIDFGLSHTSKNQTEIALSVLDFGFTSQNYKTYDVNFTESLYYPKESLYQSIDPEKPDYIAPQYAMKLMTDSIPYITSVNEIESRIIQMLPVQLHLQVKHTLPNNLQIGISNHYTYYRSYSNNYLSGFVYSPLGQNFEASSTLTLYNTNKILFGLGGSYTRDMVQFYISTNNILELIQPSSAKNLNLWFGVNLLFSTN